MITFWILAIAMIIIALVFLIRPLRSDLKQNDIDRTAQNVQIAKERLNELKLELAEGAITQSEYEQTQQELEQSLLIDVEQNSSDEIKTVDTQPLNRVAQLVLILSVPVLAIGFYAYLGQPDLLNGTQKQAAAPGGAGAGHSSSNGETKLGSVEEMVDKLAAKMKEQPDNAEGWFMLARSYMSLKRYQEAVDALEKTNQLVPNNPVIMLRYADALTMLRGGQISGKPFELIKRAVEISPDDPTGLWLLGMGYEEQGEYKKAISYWNLLLPMLKDEQSITEVKGLIRRARKKGNIDVAEMSITPKTQKEANQAGLSLKVNISKSILSKVSKTDTVFVFAKAVNGPPMPLAIVRKQVKDFPLTVTLNDSMAMMPTMKLSNFKEVQVVARISKSGTPKAQSGDYESAERIVTVNQKDLIKLTINNLLP